MTEKRVDQRLANAIGGHGAIENDMSRAKYGSRLKKFEQEALAHLDALTRAARRILRNPEETEDAVQETFLRAWKYFESFETGSNCRAWLFRIMFNVINGRKSREAKSIEVPAQEETVTRLNRDNVVTFDPLRRLEGREVLEATGRLSDEYRSVLWLVVVEEFTYREAAEILDVPIGTVMSRLHRARRMLRKLLLSEGAGNSIG